MYKHDIWACTLHALEQVKYPCFRLCIKRKERERERTIGCDEVTLSVLFKPIIDLNYNLKGHT